jgi:hypothetical protein
MKQSSLTTRPIPETVFSTLRPELMSSKNSIDKEES